MIGCTRGSTTPPIWRSRSILSTKPVRKRCDAPIKSPAPGFFAAGQPTSRACSCRIASASLSCDGNRWP
jgi:hypothetical protein